MDYVYTSEEKEFRETYYYRCGFDNTLFTDLPLEMQPPKVRNEIAAICHNSSDTDIHTLMNNEVSVGQYIAEHPAFFDEIKKTDGIKSFRENREYLLARNSYDTAREKQINGMNNRIQKMFEQAMDIDRNELMEKASDRDKIVCDVFSDTIADLNKILNKKPDNKTDVLKTLRVNSVYELGQMFGVNAEPNTEAFNRLFNVFCDDPQAEYSPFIVEQMRKAYPSVNVSYEKMDENYVVDSMEHEKTLSTFVDALDEKSPLAVDVVKYGEKVVTDVKENPFFSDVLKNYSGRCKESSLISKIEQLSHIKGDSPDVLYAHGIMKAGVQVKTKASNHLRYLCDSNGDRIDSFSFDITESAIRYMLQMKPSLKMDVILKTIKQNDPFLHYLNNAEQNQSLACIVESITNNRAQSYSIR